MYLSWRGLYEKESDDHYALATVIVVLYLTYTEYAVTVISDSTCRCVAGAKMADCPDNVKGEGPRARLSQTQSSA